MEKPNVAIVDNQLLESLISKIEALNEKVSLELDKARKPYLTTLELMELTGFGKNWVNDNKHLIGFTTIGTHLRFKRKDVEEFIEQNYFKVQQAKNRRSSEYRR